jgi:hypothetical protein
MWGNNDHPLTERELNNTIAGWLSAGIAWAAITDWLRYWQIQVKWYILWWMLLCIGVPVMWFFATPISDEYDPSSSGLTGRDWFWLSLEALVIVGGIIVIWCDWHRQVQARKVQYQQFAVQQQQMTQQQAQYAQAAHFADQQRQAKMTGQAVVDAMRVAYGEAQGAPTTPSGPSQARRNVIDVKALPPAPQAPTGPSQRPSGPPPPMGSGTPTLWVPTYQGPVQRRETTLGGTTINDRRRIDPDDL